jgi:ferritin
MATISKNMQKAIAEQTNAELYSAYLYLAMAGYFEGENLPGMAAWMRIQWQEEIGHAMKFIRYVQERAGAVKLAGIAQPPSSWDSPLAAFEAAYAHEQKVTQSIHELVNLSSKEKDLASVNFLQWYVSEQVEEESQTDRIVQALRKAGKEGGAVLMLDHHLGQRKSGA